MPDIIQQLLDLKEWSQDSARYERRLNFRGAGLVQRGPGYKPGGLVEPGVTHYGIKTKNLPEGIGYKLSTQTGKPLYYFSVGSKGNKIENTRRAENPNSLKDIVELRENALEELYPNRLVDSEFKTLRKKFSKLTAEEFANKLNTLKRTTSTGRKWTTGNLISRMSRLSIKSEAPTTFGVGRPIAEIKEIIRNSTGGKEFLKTFGNNENILRKRAYIIKGMQVTKEKFGSFATGPGKEYKLWNNYFRASTGGDRIIMEGTWNGKDLSKFENWPRNEKGQINWNLKGANGEPAWKNVKFIDTKVPDKNNPGKFKSKTFTWNIEKLPNGKYKYVGGNLKSQVDNAFTSGFFNKSTVAYDVQTMSGTKNIMYEGRSLPIKQIIAERMIENEYKKKHKKLPSRDYISRRLSFFSFQETHHPYGIANDPYFTELASKAANNKLSALESKYRTKIAKTPGNKAQLIKEFKNEVKLLSEEFGNIRTGQVIDTGGLTGKKATSEELLETGLKQADIKSKTKLYNQILQSYRDVGIGDKCGKAEGGRIGFAAGGYDQCMNNAIQEHNKNLKSNDLTVRNEARAKQFNINKTKNMKSILSLGTKVVRSPGWLLGGRWGALLEGVAEGAFYEWGRRQGQSHEEARENYFFPKIVEKWVPDVIKDTELWKKYGIKPFKTGILGGPEELIEEELRGTNKVVQRYMNNENALYEVRNKYYQLATGYQIATTGRERNPEKAEGYLKAAEAVWEEINRLEDQLDLDRDTYQAAVEKQQTERGKVAQDYGYYGKGQTERFIKDTEDRRQKEMEDKFPGYGKAQIDQKLEEAGYTVDPNLTYKKVKDPWLENYGKNLIDISDNWDYGTVGDYFKDKDKMAYFAENFRLEKAGGGIAGIRRPNAIPPESGPEPQGGGLSTMFNRVKPW